MIDVLLVKYTPHKQQEAAYLRTVAYLKRQNVNLLVHDNTDLNIGLTAARNKLLKFCKSEYVVLMDYDFSELNIDFEDMTAYLQNHDNGVIVARDSREGESHKQVEMFTSCYCNFMMLRRSTLTKLNYLNNRYFVAYADWDLLNRLEVAGYKLLKHNVSTVTHLGLSNLSPNKKEIWAKDYDTYVNYWGTKSWRPE